MDLLGEQVHMDESTRSLVVATPLGLVYMKNMPPSLVTARKRDLGGDSAPD
jgi:hypothetical protein